MCLYRTESICVVRHSSRQPLKVGAKVMLSLSLFLLPSVITVEGPVDIQAYLKRRVANEDVSMKTTISLLRLYYPTAAHHYIMFPFQEVK